AEKPDLLVLPESAWIGCLNDEFLKATPDAVAEIQARRAPLTPHAMEIHDWQKFSREARDAIQKLSTESGVAIVVGGPSLEWKPTGIPPPVNVYNSAFLILPGQDHPAERYDKINLVLFGEYVPFRYQFHSVYQSLNRLTPGGAADWNIPSRQA